jgi:hypothetical protein
MRPSVNSLRATRAVQKYASNYPVSLMAPARTNEDAVGEFLSLAGGFWERNTLGEW